MSAGSSIYPVGPTMARRRSSRAGSIFLASGMMLSGGWRLIGKGDRPARSRGATQAVIDGDAQTLFGNGHDGDGRMLRPVEGTQHGEQVRGGLKQVALRAEVQAGRPAAHEGVGAEGEQRLIGCGVMGAKPDWAAGGIVAGELTRGFMRLPIGAGRLVREGEDCRAEKRFQLFQRDAAGA